MVLLGLTTGDLLVTAWRRARPLATAAALASTAPAVTQASMVLGRQSELGGLDPVAQPMPIALVSSLLTLALPLATVALAAVVAFRQRR
jgi:hypothetical protein